MAAQFATETNDLQGVSLLRAIPLDVVYTRLLVPPDGLQAPPLTSRGRALPSPYRRVNVLRRRGTVSVQRP